MSQPYDLRTLNFFADLSADEAGALLAVCKERDYGDGAAILEEGERGPGLFVLVQGGATVLKAVKGEHLKAISELRPGDHFGEMSLVRESPVSATVQAKGNTRCLFIEKNAFHDLTLKHPNIGQKVLWVFVRTLSDRLTEIDRRYANILQSSDRRSAIRHLVMLASLQWSMLISYFWVWVRLRFLRWPMPAEKLSRLHRKYARRFKDVAFTLKGANIKIGQLASMQAHILPPEYIEEFQSMRDQVTATEFPMIASQIQSEFGMSPLELFEEFDRVPIAAASMGQVHVARLRSGEKVVVKVLHPGLERSVAIDLWLTRQTLSAVAKFIKKFDLMMIYRESEEPLRKELDLLHEGKATEELAKELAPLGVKVPKVYWRYSTKRVLTLEFIEGCNIDDFEQLRAWNIDREALMRKYLEAFFHQAFLGGYFHCDPHPGNAFCTPQGQLALLDFGMVKRMPENVRNGVVMEILGGFFNNPKLYVDGMMLRGIVGEEDRFILEKTAAEVFSDPKMRAAIFDHDIKEQSELKQLFGVMADLLKNLKTFKTPQDQLMFMRATGIAIDVTKEILPEKPVSELVMPLFAKIMQEFLQKNPQYLSVMTPQSLAKAS